MIHFEAKYGGLLPDPEVVVRLPLKERAEALNFGFGLIQKNYSELEERNGLLEDLACEIDGLVWIKKWIPEEAKHVYEFANRKHGDLFFRFERCENCKDCGRCFMGKTDLELLDDFRKRTGIRHTYGELCGSTDIHSMMKGIEDIQKGRPVIPRKYIEFGIVGDQQLILEVSKRPKFDENNNYVRNIGNALDQSQDKTIFQRVEILMENGLAEKLGEGVYYIKPNFKDFPMEQLEAELKH